MDESRRHELLGIARRAIEEALEPERRMHTPRSAADKKSGIFSERWGAFVSIHVGGELRGCVGMISPAEPLAGTIRECAQAAATRDNRFPPLSADELPGARIEISILIPPVPLEDPSQIEIGRHGLIVSRGGRKGLLLPQVATREGWDRGTFLDQTCVKAGLPPGDWQAGAQVEVFEAVVFGEAESSPSAY